MALRPLRNATITFGLVNIPVRFYTATRSEDVHFNMLHESCGTRVSRKWWCTQCDRGLEQGEMVRGYPISRNQYVTFTDAELEALESDEERALEITEFVDLEQIDPVFFEKAYYLGPASGGAKTYRLLAEAMRKQNKVAVARWVSGHREHLVVLRPFETGLVLHTMFYADEVRDFGAIEAESGEVKEKEIALAELLINELSVEQFDPLQYRDAYRERLLEKIRAKSEGQVIVSERPEEPQRGEVIDIMEALRRSLEAAAPKPSERKPAKRATRKDADKAVETSRSPRKRRVG